MQYVSQPLLDEMFAEAEGSDRRRAFHRFHNPDDALNRLLIAGLTGSYATPHRHAEKFEAFAHVEGEVLVVEFDDTGKPLHAYSLKHCPYVEFGPMTWHTVIYTSPRWAVMEFALWKEKYDPSDKEFAPWAPKEGDPAAGDYLKSLTATAQKLSQG